MTAVRVSELRKVYKIFQNQEKLVRYFVYSKAVLQEQLNNERTVSCLFI